MKVTAEGNLFTLRAECAQDRDFIAALCLHQAVAIGSFVREDMPGYGGGRRTVGVVLEVDAAGQRSLEAQAARECLGALGKLLGLGLREAARHGLVVADATDPQPQKELAASLEKLQLMVESLREMVGQQGAVLQEMQRAHGTPSCVVSGRDIVAEKAGSPAPDKKEG